MPTVRLEFDLDSEVYPELHAVLAALSPQARGERLRQLAATGLVWEKVRIHGPSAMASPGATAPVATASSPAKPSANPAASAPPPGAYPQVLPVTPPTPVKPAAPMRAAVSLDLPEPLPTLERRPSAPKRARAAAPTERRRASDFVDLAINAEPMPRMAPAELDRPSRLDVEQVIRELPVLNDVVMDVEEDDDAPLSVHGPLSDEPQPVLEEEADTWSPASTYDVDPEPLPPVPAPAPATTLAAASAHGDEADGDVPSDADPGSDDALHVTALAHKPQARSRLKRMKERGLFKNG